MITFHCTLINSFNIFVRKQFFLPHGKEEHKFSLLEIRTKYVLHISFINLSTKIRTKTRPSYKALAIPTINKCIGSLVDMAKDTSHYLLNTITIIAFIKLFLHIFDIFSPILTSDSGVTGWWIILFVFCLFFKMVRNMRRNAAIIKQELMKVEDCKKGSCIKKSLVLAKYAYKYTERRDLFMVSTLLFCTVYAMVSNYMYGVPNEWVRYYAELDNSDSLRLPPSSPSSIPFSIYRKYPYSTLADKLPLPFSSEKDNPHYNTTIHGGARRLIHNIYSNTTARNSTHTAELFDEPPEVTVFQKAVLNIAVQIFEYSGFSEVDKMM